MKVKLVEKLNLIDYSRKLFEALDLKNLSSEGRKAIDSGDIKQINKILDTEIFALDTNGDPTLNDKYYPYLSAIQNSIQQYSSLDINRNPFIALLDAVKDLSKIDANLAFSISESLGRNSISVRFILRDLANKDGLDDLLVQDQSYIIALLSTLSSKNKAREYTNKEGEFPTLNNILNGNKFKSLDEIKKAMDEFVTDEEDQSITLKELLDDILKWENTKRRDLWIKLINTDNKVKTYPEDKKQALIRFFQELYAKDVESKKRRDKIYLGTKVSADWDLTHEDDAHNIITAILKYKKKYLESDSEDDGIDSSLNKFLQDKGITDLEDQIEFIKKAINDSNEINDTDKQNVELSLNKLLTADNKNLLDQLLNTVNVWDEKELPTAVNNFIKKAANQNYLYTTISDALISIGKQPEQGKNVLAQYISNDQALSAALENVWKNSALQKSLLNARITKTKTGFNWAQAIREFLEDIAERDYDLSLRSFLNNTYNTLQLKDQLNKIFDIIKSSNQYNKNDLNWLKVRLSELLDIKNNNLAQQLLDLEIIDEKQIPLIIGNFISKNMPDFGYTTIREALRLSGINTPETEGHKFLASSAFKKQLGERSKFLTRFEEIWNSKTLKNALLNSRIEFQNGKFNWLKAINNFMDRI